MYILKMKGYICIDFMYEVKLVYLYMYIYIYLYSIFYFIFLENKS